MMIKKNLSMIAAMAPNNGIGYKNQLPWKCSDDMKWFKEYTTGKNVIMGMETFKSLNSKPLPNRKNYVLTRNLNQKIDGVELVDFSIMQKYINFFESEKFVVIGGSKIYELFSDYISEAYITYINKNIINENQKFDSFLFLPEQFNIIEVINEHENCTIKKFTI